MLFCSPVFFLFAAFYFLAHWTIPFRARLLLIIIGSTIFYGYWNPTYIWVCYFLTLLGYTGGIIMGQAKNRRRTLVILIAIILSPLLLFKYLNFFLTNLSLLYPLDSQYPMSVHALPNWPLPLGISFITFTTLSYIVDIYRGTCPVETGILRYTACILFFPHLIAGPIVRPHQLIPQIARNRPTIYAGLLAGLGIFTLGLVKKLVFADSVGMYVDRVFNNAGAFSGAEYCLAIYGFAMQIYCDFSGYTDMAIGIAIALGVKLPNNFKRPYQATSLPDFWKRWHITLSSWLRDYLYFPLGGNRSGLALQCRNILITMALGGLWHGASWNFVLWGTLHGIGIGVAHWFSRIGTKIPLAVSKMATFQFVVILWVFFRAKELPTLARVLTGPFLAQWSLASLQPLLFPLGLIGVFLVTHRFDSHRLVRRAIFKTPAAVVFPALIFLWVIAIAFSHGNFAEFIYFDF